MLLFGCFQALLILCSHPAEQCKKLPIELANGAFVHEQPTLLQFTLNFDQLTMIMLMTPANEGQHIQPIGTVGQTDGQDSTGVVGGAGMWTGRIETAVALAGDKDGAIEGLDILLDVPGVAWGELVATMQTYLAITRDDQPARIGKLA
jgi:hypothetical protein